MIDFVRTVGLEITLASYGLLEESPGDRENRPVDLCCPLRGSLYPGTIGATFDDNVASKSTVFFA